MTARRLGPYVLGDRLGSGGMGVVYCAARTGPLGFVRPVAVKELHPHLARDADFVAMLVDEARIQGAIDHPNVVPVVDVVARGGELYLVLGLVQGVSLAELLGRARERASAIPEPVAIAIACGLLEGLHAAHELSGRHGERIGVVHRDVSPHNVLVAADGVARVVDFGIAKSEAQAHVTLTGQLRGKPGYMSPEQLDGAPLDRRSDLFSAALVIVEMLTLERPFSASEAREVRGAMAATLADPRAWLRARGLREPLTEALAPSLSVERDARPTTARDVQLALARVSAPGLTAEVAAWVEELASDLVDERRRAVADVLASAASSEVTETTRPEVRAAPRVRSATASARPRAWTLAVAGALLLGGFAWGRSSSETSASARPSLDASLGAEAPTRARAAATTASAQPVTATASAALLAPSAATATTTAAVVPAAATAPTTTAAVVPASAAATVVPAPPRGLATPARASAPTASVAPLTRAGGGAPSCKPPYVVDDRGVRTFKLECL